MPLVILLFVSVLYWRRQKVRKLGDERLVAEQIQGQVPGRSTTKFILLTLGLSAIIIGWANLRAGDKSEKVERKGVDVIVALDVSKSMLARDIQPDRLTRSKQMVMRLTDKMKNDRLALIVFAGKPYLQVPLTIDYSAVKMLLQAVSPDMVPTQGTVIGEAIGMAMETFTKNERKYKTLIVISDGEDHDEKALQMAKEAADAGVVIHTVGIGSPQGSTLYDEETKSVKLDENGNAVISKLNEEALRRIARAGHGSYSLLQNTDEIADKIAASLEAMEQKSLGSVVYTDFTSYYQYFLLAGFLALLIEWLLPGSKKTRIAKADVAGIVVKGKTALVIVAGICFVLAASDAAAQTDRFIKQGNKLYDQMKYDEAAAHYEKALKKDPTYTPGLFNLGNTLYQQKKYDESRKIMEATAKGTKDKDARAAANYNVGNTYMSQQKWEEAVQSYKHTLRANPQDADAKYNLSYAEQMLKKQNQDKKNDKNKQNKNQNKDQQNKDKQQQDKDQQNKDKQEKDNGQSDKRDQQDKEQQRPQGQPSKLSQQQAEQLLNALQQEEKKLQDKMKKEKGVPVKLQKDW